MMLPVKRIVTDILKAIHKQYFRIYRVALSIASVWDKKVDTENHI